MSFRVDAKQAIDGLSRIASAIPKASQSSRKISAEQAINAAKQKVHVITGRLRGSLRIISETQNTTRFGSDLFYAGIEEFRPGHSYIMPEYNRLQTYWPEAFLVELRTAF
jgi:hypothetical protein